MPAVALVIPAWQEAESIGAVLDELPPRSADLVLVVVGQANDPTANVARGRGACVIVQDRPGYGAACLAGAQRALVEGADILGFIDGDYSDPPAALPSLVDAVATGHADLALGARRIPRGALPTHARLGNWLVLRGMRLLLRRTFRDLPSMKVISAHSFRRLDMHEMTYGWTVEMLVKAARADLRIVETTVDYRLRLGGRSKVSGTVGGTLGAASQLVTCAVGYARWRPTAVRAHV